MDMRATRLSGVVRHTARFGGGRWFLEIPDNEGPLLWERLPDPGADDDEVVRHLSGGPGGSTFLMQAARRGVRILER